MLYDTINIILILITKIAERWLPELKGGRSEEVCYEDFSPGPAVKTPTIIKEGDECESERI